MNRFIHRAKKKKAGTVFCLVFVAALIVSGALLWRDYSHAADQIFIQYNGADLNPADTVTMNTSSMQLMLRTSGTAYDDERYKVEWTIEDPAARDVIASIGPGTSKTIGVVQAISPGDVTVTVTVKDSMAGDAVMGSTTCNIRVVFSIDTSTNDSIYKYVNESDTVRSLVLYSDSPEVDLGLNFGSADSSNTQWTSSNDEIVKVTQNGGRVTPMGAGKTQVMATYTPTGGMDTYTAYLDVYIIPQVSLSNTPGTFEKTADIQLNSGEFLYTDTNFENNLEVIRSKIIWVVKKDDNEGNSKIIADSLGKSSDLISITPTASRSNELRIEGLAGEYDVYFYTYGSYNENVNNGTSAYTPTVVHLTIKSDIQDKTEILSIGDAYYFAKSFNMTVEDFLDCFTVDIRMNQGAPDFSEYADYDMNTAVLTAKNVGNLVATLMVRRGKESYVRRLLGLEESDILPVSFEINVNITDNIQLNRTSMTIVVGQKEQLSVKLNSTYTGSITWESSASNFVTVNQEGWIEGKKVTSQDVIITATLDAGNGIYKRATCTVKVEATVSGFTLNPGTTQQMMVGEHLTVVADIRQTVTVAPLKWISSDTSVFNVKQASDGKSAILTAVGGGRATLTVYSTINDEYRSFDVIVRIPINEISFKTSSIDLEYFRKAYNMKDEILCGPTNATDTELNWVSSNSSVATVEKDGYMKFKGAGTTIVRVYPAYNPYNVMASCLVTVIGTPTSMSISKTDVTMENGTNTILEVDFTPDNTATEITWTPNDASIVSVVYDEERRLATLTGKNPGSTNVNVVTTEGLISNVKVTVKQPSTGITLSPKEVTVRTGDTTSVKATLTPGNSTDTIQWSTLNARVATVNAEGVVTGVSSGTTFIRAQAYNGKIPGATEIVQVVVRDGVKGIALDSLEKSVTVGSSISLVPIFTPESAFDKGMTWTSSNPSVAKVELSGTSNGKVTGVAPGIALITGTANDGKFTVACLVTVKAKAIANDTKVTLKPTTKYLKLRKTFYITATVTGTSNKKVKWSTSKKSVATVTSDGKVKGKKVGTAYIKATAQDGSGAYARCKVRVVRMAKKIKLNKSTAKVLVGSTLKLKATITPKNATIKKVKWSSSNNSIATVSSSGRVLGVSPGIVKIKAKATDGSGKSATCILTVQEPVEATGVTVENGSITVAKGKAVQSGIVAAPANTTTKIKYYSDNKKVATVDKRGKIRTKRAGQATIYGETANGKIGYVDVLVVDLNRKGLVMRQYDTEQLHVNEISTGVTWYSKNINVATVDSTGKVTGRKKGTTTIYAVVNGVKLGCRVQIKKIK